MIPEIIQKWEINKHKLKEYFKTTNKSEYMEYTDIVKKIFELVINDCDDEFTFNIDRLVVIDHGDRQGTLLYIIPKNIYQPCNTDYIATNNYYGSCSGCDTLESIHEYETDLPSEDEVRRYMLLSLHLIKQMKWLYTYDEIYNS